MKIMIVDDEPLILIGIENIIINEFNGYIEIVKAFDGKGIEEQNMQPIYNTYRIHRF